MGRLAKEGLGYPAILLEEAGAFLGNGFHGSDGGDFRSALALKAKLTCAGSLLARGRRFKVARQVDEIVQRALLLIGNGPWDGNGQRDEIRHKVAEGCSLLRSYLGHEQKGGGAR